MSTAATISRPYFNTFIVIFTHESLFNKQFNMESLSI